MKQPPTWFLELLNDTIEWCRDRVEVEKPESCLRSDFLHPAPSVDAEECKWLNIDSGMISQLLSKRRHTLQKRRDFRIQPASTLSGGRLLLCAYEYTNHNGASADATKCFFDNMDVPPWDTWVGEVAGTMGPDAAAERGSSWPPTLASTLSGGLPNRGILVAWIPEAFKSMAQSGIDAECIGMICWGDSPTGLVGGAGPRFDLITPEWLGTLREDGPAS